MNVLKYLEKIARMQCAGCPLKDSCIKKDSLKDEQSPLHGTVPIDTIKKI